MAPAHSDRHEPSPPNPSSIPQSSPSRSNESPVHVPSPNRADASRRVESTRISNNSSSTDRPTPETTTRTSRRPTTARTASPGTANGAALASQLAPGEATAWANARSCSALPSARDEPPKSSRTRSATLGEQGRRGRPQEPPTPAHRGDPQATSGSRVREAIRGSACDQSRPKVRSASAGTGRYTTPASGSWRDFLGFGPSRSPISCVFKVTVPLRRMR